MKVKVDTCRQFLKCEGVQVSTEAAFSLAQVLDEMGVAIALEAHKVLEEENRVRAVQGLEPRARLSVADLDKAIERLG